MDRIIEKILIPIDSIEWDNTLTAVKNAIGLAQGCKVNGPPELIFMHVFNVHSRTSMSERERVMDLKKKKIEEEFEKIEEICKENNVENIRKELKEGNPVNEIIETAKEEDASIIVMGSGKLHDESVGSKIHKFFYGSTTEEVIHGAPCSVLVARPMNESE